MNDWLRILLPQPKAPRVKLTANMKEYQRLYRLKNQEKLREATRERMRRLRKRNA